MAKQTTKKEVPVVAPVSKGYPEIVDMRLSQIRFRASELKAEIMVITHLPNIRYLTNFSGSSAMLFIFDEKYDNKIYFFTDDRYSEQVKTELYPLPNLHAPFITRDVWAFCMENKLLKGIDSLAFEGDKIAYSTAVEIRNRIRPYKFKPTEHGEVDRFMVRKAPEELANIEKACQIAEEVYNKIIKKIKPGISEIEIAIEIAYESRKMGSENDPFDIIVTSGNRGGLVHGKPTDKKIKLGDIVILDFGVRYNGFCCDITRTVAVGKATKEQKSVYDILYKAKEAAINGVLPSMNGKNLDRIARSIIEKAGYGQYFQHSLGHGIGIDVHEYPTITFRMEDQNIPEDCVLAIEPGIYLPEKFGMRIEDDIYITRQGARKLTNAPAELPVI